MPIKWHMIWPPARILKNSYLKMPGCSIPADIAGLTAQTLDSLATQPLKEIADMLARGGINQQKRAVKIQNWLALDPAGSLQN